MKSFTIFIVQSNLMYACELQYKLQNHDNLIHLFTSIEEMEYYKELNPDAIIIGYDLAQEALKKTIAMKDYTSKLILTKKKTQTTTQDTQNFVLLNENDFTQIQSHLNNDSFRFNLLGQGHILIATLGLLLTMLGSCANYNLIQTTETQDLLTEERPSKKKAKQTTYTASTAEMPIYNLLATNENKKDYLLQTDDKISVSIWKHNDLSVGSIFSDYSSNEVYGKWLLINSDGHITLPQVGEVALAGLSIQEAEIKLIDLYKQDIVDPIVVLKVLNRKVTVLGEVKDAGNILLEKENYTFTEVIGKAGGFKDFADTRQIKLIRNGITYELNLTTIDAQLLNTLPILTGDFIYIPAQTSKSILQKSPVIIPITSAITTLVLVLTLFRQ